ncbi:MAG TPA: hypothetical protein VFY77_06740 [Nitrososphaeraceae archaeon]|jgi:hypothetical protein|nr:hypothetical protein [Nitrososphaeraceae archaeon]HZB64977.1 hypothetical protein [Nitrososphaeraceae archaeon]
MIENDNKANDKIVYFGVININEKGKNIGAIDVWRSVITKELFCEEKRLGILDIAEDIGMPKIEKGKKWAVAVNRNRFGKDRWKLIKILEEGILKFFDTDDETIINTNVKNYQIIDNDWWNFLVENNINRSIEITKEL